MTFTVKISLTRSTMVCAYTCPEHGEFDAEVKRDETGGAPEVVPCPVIVPVDAPHRHAVFIGEDFVCSTPATWTPSAVSCRVRRIEAVKGKWEKPERKTFLDTRELAEGQDMDEFRAKRSAIWDEKRKAEVMAFKKGL